MSLESDRLEQSLQIQQRSPFFSEFISGQYDQPAWFSALDEISTTYKKELVKVYGKRWEKRLLGGLISSDYSAIYKLPRAESPRFSSSLQETAENLSSASHLPAEDCNHFSIHPRFKKAGFSASDYKNNEDTERIPKLTACLFLIGYEIGNCRDVGIVTPETVSRLASIDALAPTGEITRAASYVLAIISVMSEGVDARTYADEVLGPMEERVAGEESVTLPPVFRAVMSQMYKNKELKGF